MFMGYSLHFCSHSPYLFLSLSAFSVCLSFWSSTPLLLSVPRTLHTTISPFSICFPHTLYPDLSLPLTQLYFPSRSHRGPEFVPCT
ncbi:hypothetical protein BDP81DRAFT_420036 [Colletotrichum phormii]|uniref:Uncharacterized protein n=1 Tax=Colletotrichum phormii TaxID=359342 RepID=A0AAI9ZYY8_9PEZI|nr:uncharacterized protein BDP81DRAFT_420036 [Colletotrichum phormii]KAK1640431.1 hypothetical protein BDP81DRAFT_420036 [Colletotrichum phormii]